MSYCVSAAELLLSQIGSSPIDNSGNLAACLRRPGCPQEDTMKKRPENPEEHIAIHEAGHAAAAYIYQLPFIRVSITQQGLDGALSTLTDTKARHSWTLRGMKERLSISLAGRAAEIAFFGKHYDDMSLDAGDSRDITLYLDALEKFWGVVVDVTKMGDKLRRKFSTPQWHDVISALADALIEQREIDYLKALEIIEGTLASRQAAHP